MDIIDLILLSIIAAIVIIITNHINTSRYARMAAKRHCDKHDLQLLDQNVVLKRLRLRRSYYQLFAIERTYYFEFSSVGDYRYKGKIILIARRVDSIELDAYKMQYNHFLE